MALPGCQRKFRIRASTRLVRQLTNDGYTNYDALLINFCRAFAHGFRGQISFTWSHALDTLSNGGLLPFSYSDR
jgi:hypothetical protein